LRIVQVTNVDFSLRQFLLPLMRALREQGHEVIGMAAEGKLLDDARAEGFTIIPIPFERSLSPLAHWRAFRALARAFRTLRPDLVHAHMPISGFLARMAAWWVGVPRIAYTCHGFLFNQEGGRALKLITWLMEVIAARVTHLYMTVSSKEAHDAKRLRIRRDAVAIGNGRDPARFRPDQATRARIRDELGAGDRVVFVAVSRLVRAKGYAELAEAMRALPDAVLWVVGERLESDRGDDMAALLDGAGLGDRLRRLGYRADVDAVLAGADVFVLPSYYEGLPMSVIEAMLTGLPVIASDIPGVREQVVEGETGLLVPPRLVEPLAAAMRRLAADAGERARMGEAGRARAVAVYDERVVLGRVLLVLGG
jgi:glycosyltransferase involved in cell wall biosynthesis